jgi:hypothetical protein
MIGSTRYPQAAKLSRLIKDDVTTCIPKAGAGRFLNDEVNYIPAIFFLFHAPCLQERDDVTRSGTEQRSRQQLKIHSNAGGEEQTQK